MRKDSFWKQDVGFGAECEVWSDDRRTLIRFDRFDGEKWISNDEFEAKYGGGMDEGCDCKDK